MRKVVFVISSTDRGGAERQAFNLGKGLQEKALADVSFVCYKTNPNGLFLRDLKDSGMKYFTLPGFVRVSNFRLRCVLRFLVLFRQISVLYAADILMPYAYEMNLYVGLFMLLKRKTKCIWNQRDEGVGYFAPWLKNTVMKRFDFFISNSFGGRLFLEQMVTASVGKNRIIYNGVEIDKMQTSVPIIDSKNERFTICMVANLQPLKDHLTLVKAMNYLKNEIHYKALPYLLFAGYKGGTYPILLDYVNKHHLNEDVRFLGEVDNPQSLYVSADIVVLSSKSEGCSNSLIEAMMLNCPIIATDIPSIRDMVSDMGASALFRVGDYVGFSDILVKLIEDKDLRTEIGKTNYLKAKERYTLSTLLEHTTHVFEQLKV